MKTHRRLNRGSALIYTSMLSMAIATVIVSTAQLNRAASDKAERQIDLVKSEESESGVLAAVRAKCNVNDIVLPQTWNFTLNGQAQSVSITDASATMARCYNVVTTINGTTTRTYKRLIAGRQTANPLYFALWCDRNTDLSAIRLTTTNSGHVFCRGNLTLSPTTTVDGEVFAVGTLTDNGATATKNMLSPVRNRTLPVINRADYEAAAAGIINSLSSIVGIVFGPALLGMPYSLKYYDKNADLSGVISGKGTAYIKGNVKAIADVTYSNAAARAVIIVDGDLEVKRECSRLDGLWFVLGKVKMESTATPLTITRGAIIAYDDFNPDRDVIIGGDTTFWTSRNDGTRHRAPGFWPTADGGLFR